MADIYNLTITNSSSVFGLVSAADSVTLGWLGMVILIGVFIVVLSNLLRNNTFAEAFLATSFICAIISSLLYVLGFLGMNIVFILGVMTIIGLVAAYNQNR